METLLNKVDKVERVVSLMTMTEDGPSQPVSACQITETRGLGSQKVGLRIQLRQCHP